MIKYYIAMTIFFWKKNESLYSDEKIILLSGQATGDNSASTGGNPCKETSEGSKQ